ncbi:MAG: 50S ribosomal protein L21 [Deltaproteobacteria bacterium RIFCSPHIGHO2_02_FULL_40_11]|nr:MAG: 50S ribosomal protein L21 [Deltaproteobacteria bacterium RIFCSPHIGHO2_02_FULL_40_11]
MFAIIETGSKQYKAKVGDFLTVEKLEGTPGSEIVLSQVLLVQDKTTTIGTPTIQNAGVLCEIMEQERGPKIITYKYKRRKGSKRKKGHRQWYTLLKVKEISLEGVTAKKASAAEKTSVKKVVTKKTPTKKSTPKTTSKITKDSK